MLTNIEADHLEHYEGSFAKLVDTYQAFVNNVKEGDGFLCCDDPLLKKLSSGFRPKSVSYGLPPVRTCGDNVKLEGLGSRFSVVFKGELLGEMDLKVPGLHNVRNALGATAVALDLDLDFCQIKEAFSTFEGARRRFEVVGEVNDVLIVDDYAHHPTEIRATLEAARESGRRIICLFQPHRFTRTKFLWQEFVGAFDAADLLLLTDIYPAGEEPILEVTSGRLAREIKERGFRHVYYFSEPSKAVDYVRKIVRKGDLVLTMGAEIFGKPGEACLVCFPRRERCFERSLMVNLPFYGSGLPIKIWPPSVGTLSLRPGSGPLRFLPVE